MDYGVDLNSGALEPRRIDDELHVFPERPSAEALLAGAAAAADFPNWLARLAPQDRRYAALLDRYEDLSRIVAAGGWRVRVGRGETLRPGARSERVARAAARACASSATSRRRRPIWPPTARPVPAPASTTLRSSRR